MLVVLMSIVSNVASAHDFEVDGIYYNITSSSAPLTVAVTFQGSYSGGSDEYSGSVTIPETVTYNGNTYSVTSIEDAFAFCSGLTSIIIPNSVTSIEGMAFYGCRALTSVTIPENVTEIGGAAFFGCFENSYKFATYFYRREFMRLYFYHIVDIVDNGCQRDTRVDRILNLF